MRTRRRTRSGGAFAAMAVLGLVTLGSGASCSSASNGAASGDDGGSSSGGGEGGGGCAGFGCNSSSGGGDDSGVPNMTCPLPTGMGSGFQCTIPNCSGGMTTTIRGTVFDPAGNLPLYNVAVYIPNAAPVDLPEGVSCASCQSWYTAPVVSAVTDAGGNFTITGAPAGDNIPLIVQVGKWRKVYKLSHVTGCASNDAAALAGAKLRLPKNRAEGHIPNIAISTGDADSLECLIRRIGIDPGEYTGDPTPAADKPRIHIFTGGNAPAMLGGAQTQAPISKQSYQYLWLQDQQMQAYDVVLLSCEGAETSYLSDVGRTVLYNYANMGGRVFASHYHYSFFTPTGPFTMTTPALATWSPDGNGKSPFVVPGDSSSVTANVITTLPNGQMFPEGVALHQWLANVGALQNDKLPIWYARHNADLTPTNAASQGWIQLDPTVMGAANAAEYFSFDTPIGGGREVCGRVVYSDLHVSGGIGAQNDKSVPADYPSGLAITPDGCAMHPLTPQEKALEFMLFDLSSCLTPVADVPKPPQPAK